VHPAGSVTIDNAPGEGRIDPRDTSLVEGMDVEPAANEISRDAGAHP
jgi:hypothetical protein